MWHPHLHGAPLRAGSQRRASVHGGVPRNRGKNTTLVASLSLEGIGEAMAFEGATTKAVFESYVEQVLAPSLRPGRLLLW